MQTKEKTKAAQYLYDRGLRNPPLDSGISGGGNAPRVYASIAMQEYADDFTQDLATSNQTLLDEVNRLNALLATDTSNKS